MLICLAIYLLFGSSMKNCCQPNFANLLHSRIILLAAGRSKTLRKFKYDITSCRDIKILWSKLYSSSNFLIGNTKLYFWQTLGPTGCYSYNKLIINKYCINSSSDQKRNILTKILIQYFKNFEEVVWAKDAAFFSKITFSLAYEI